MVQFVSIIFFSWISSIFVGVFQKFPFFFVSFCMAECKAVLLGSVFQVQDQCWQFLSVGCLMCCDKVCKLHSSHFVVATDGIACSVSAKGMTQAVRYL